jgi:predicted AlkP superfamily phosphohydrolase/phosphomutase
MLRRTLASAAIAGALFAAQLVVLTLHLDPELPLGSEAPALALSIFLPYALIAFLGLSTVAVGVSYLRGLPPVRPPFRKLPWLTALTLIATLVSAGLYAYNLAAYRLCVPRESLPALLGSTATLLACALVLAAAGADVVFFPRHSRAAASAIVLLTLGASLAVPLALRPIPAPIPPRVELATEPVVPLRRVVLIGVDGLGPELLTQAMARGGVPVLSRLARRGAWGPLGSLRPTLPPVLWASAFTGQLPRDHGVKGFVAYRLRGSDTSYEILPSGVGVSLLERVGLVSRVPITSAARHAPALWDALDAFGIASGVVRFWGTWPPQPIRGFMLANSFHVLRGTPRASEALQPPDLLGDVEARAVDATDVGRTLVPQLLDPAGSRDRPELRRALAEGALGPDLTYRRAALALRSAHDPPFFAFSLHGLDVVGHSFLRFARPEQFGNVQPDEARRYGRVLDRYLAWIDDTVGEVASGLRPGEVLFVVSTYGMQPSPLPRRIWQRLLGEPAYSGTHDDAPDGVLIAFGDGVRPGTTLSGLSVVDLAPTVLYLMGLPVARDMEGRVRTDLVDDAFLRAHPVTFVPSYRSLVVTPASPLPAGPDLPPLPEGEP